LILYPAIDIREGRTVRLIQGDYARETAYDEDPVVAARRWAQAGSQWLHVVDLDGAREGEPVNLDQVRRIVAAVGVPVQLGGGLRDSGQVERALEAGAERIVLGTSAVTDPDLAEALASAHGDRLVVSVDARGGRVSHSGWTERTTVTPERLIAELAERGVKRFVFTPVDADGLMEGPALDQLAELATAARAPLIYSGGVGSLDDLRRITELELENLEGVIVGRALYEERFTVAEAQAALAG
jgi:phosphoribosylformimino-5-aminoimidazole carboxamide ribotide isomerase